jgi:hypothetical protein
MISAGRCWDMFSKWKYLYHIALLVLGTILPASTVINMINSSRAIITSGGALRPIFASELTMFTFLTTVTLQCIALVSAAFQFPGTRLQMKHFNKNLRTPIFAGRLRFMKYLNTAIWLGLAVIIGSLPLDHSYYQRR